MDHSASTRNTLANLALGEVYKLIEPGPVVLLATSNKGRDNVMTMSWHMMMEFEPPLIGCVVSSANHSFETLRRARQCVIALPGVEMAETVVSVGNCSGRDTDKFERFDIARQQASEVAAPLLTACFANLECRVTDTRMVNRHNLFVLEVVKAWARRGYATAKTIHHRGYGTFTVDGESIRLKSGMP